MKTVLIVGDSEFISFMLKKSCPNKINVLSVPSVEEATIILDKNDINIVVLNLKLSLENMQKIADKIQEKYDVSIVIFENVEEPNLNHTNLDINLLSEQFKYDNIKENNKSKSKVKKYNVKHRKK